MKEPFSTFQRTIKKADGEITVFYVKYRNPKTGTYMTPISLDKLNELLGDRSGKRITSKAKAIRIAQLALDRKLCEQTEVKKAADKGKAQKAGPKPKPIYFVDYCKACWDFDTSDYIRRKNKEKPNAISRAYAESELRAFNLHVAPKVSGKLLLGDFDPSIIHNIRNSMVDAGYAGSTISKVMQCVRTPLHQAYLSGLIKEDVADRIENVASSFKTKGIMTEEEVRRMLSWLDSTSPKGTPKRAEFLTAAVAAYTGMRLGEIRALRAEDIHILGGGCAYIHVSHSYNDTDGLKCTKGKYARDVTCPMALAQELLGHSGLNPDGYIFSSPYKPSVPVSPNYIRDSVYKAMDAIGIGDDLRKERNVTFHSLRHYYVSTMSEFLSAEEVMDMTGHKSLAMHERYNHMTESKLRKNSEQREKAMPFTY